MKFEYFHLVRVSDQRGAATTVISLTLLGLMTMVAAYTSRTVLFEQKVSANDFRERQAFEAAESGLATALSYISSPGGADKDGDGGVDPVFDTDADGIGDSSTIIFPDNSTATVAVTGAFPSLSIGSTGLSDDRTAMRLVRTLAAAVDALPNAPNNPLTTRGTVVIGGSATVHNPEGSSTIWSGADVELGSNNSTATNIADPNDPGYPVCMETPMTCDTTPSSSKVAQGLDVIPNDSSLANLSADEFFQNFFGATMAKYRASRVTVEVIAADANNLVTAGSPGIHLAVGEVIWVEGDTSLNGVTVGCEVKVIGNNTCPDANLDPSILIINGDLDTNGTPHFYGVVYVVGDINLSGSTTVTGAMIVGGTLTSAGGGSLDIWYNSDVLEDSRDNGPLGAAPGSWQDW